MEYKNNDNQAQNWDVTSKPMSLQDWIYTYLLLLIPIANVVLMFVWAFGSDVNKSKKTVDVKFYFTKEDGTENWYPYYDIIPDLHVTEVYHLEPEKVEHINSEITVKTDDVRLITSHFTDADVKYEIIK